MIKKALVGLAATALTAGAIAYATMVPSGLRHSEYKGHQADGIHMVYQVSDRLDFHRLSSKMTYIGETGLPLEDICHLVKYKEEPNEENQYNVFNEEIVIQDRFCNNTADEITTLNKNGKFETYTRNELVYGNKAAKYDGILAKVQDKFTNPQHDADAKHQRMMKNL